MLIWQKRYTGGLCKTLRSRPLQHVFPGQRASWSSSWGVLHSPHRRCAFRIVSTALVYSQCHVVPSYPLQGRPRTRGNWGPVSPAMQSGAWASTLTGHMLVPRARQPEFRLPCRGSAGIPPPQCLRREGGGARRRSRTKSTSRSCQRAARDRLRTRIAENTSRMGPDRPRTPPDGPGSGSALRPAACTFTRPATHRPAKSIQELAATR
jgi:hypothetical protein